MASNRPGRRIQVLHVILVLGETNGEYNEHCLPLIGVRDLSICTYFAPRLVPPPDITLFPGDGSLCGFFRALRAALDAKEYDVVHTRAPHTALLLLVALLKWGRYGRVRPSLVYNVQDSFYDYKLRNQVMTLIALAAFKRVVFCSRAAYESLPRVWKWLAGNRWRVVQNGADIERVDRVIIARAPIRNAGHFTVLSVGRLENVKDPVAVVDAFAKGAGKDDCLVLVGAGTLEAAVRERVAALGLEDRVVLTGLIARDEVFVRCARADLFVSTSHGEGLPVAVIEAMASRCPVVLSDIAPHRELAEGADFIPFITLGDIDGFARAIRRFRHMSRKERLEIGRRCREHVTARFTLPIMHAGYEAVYQELARFS